MTASDRPRVVVVGAGFGGLWVARNLAGEPVEVTLVDRNNFHTFYPLLYQVGTAGLEGSEVVFPVRKILRGWRNVHFRMGEVRGVDLEDRRVQMGGDGLVYDYLVLATGSRTTYLDVPGAEEHARPLKELVDGIALRNHVLSCFEAAAVVEDPERRERLLTFAVVGGGPTGVELAGSLAELGHHPMARDYEEFGREDIEIVLLEAAERLLPDIPDTLGAYAERQLQEMGVDVRTGFEVARVEPTGLETAAGEWIGARTVVWTAGVEGAVPGDGAGLPTTERGWVRVGPDLEAEGTDGVFAIGDLAEVDGRRLPLVAPAAIQQGERVARNIVRDVEDEPPEPFRYHDKGILGAIGRNKAYARAWGRNITGVPAWLVWLAVHIRQLVGFRNRLVVLIDWLWAYFLFERPVRWIMPEWREGLLEDGPLPGAGPHPG